MSLTFFYFLLLDFWTSTWSWTLAWQLDRSILFQRKPSIFLLSFFPSSFYPFQILKGCDLWKCLKSLGWGGEWSPWLFYLWSLDFWLGLSPDNYTTNIYNQILLFSIVIQNCSTLPIMNCLLRDENTDRKLGKSIIRASVAKVLWNHGVTKLLRKKSF